MTALKMISNKIKAKRDNKMGTISEEVAKK